MFSVAFKSWLVLDLFFFAHKYIGRFPSVLLSPMRLFSTSKLSFLFLCVHV